MIRAWKVDTQSSAWWKQTRLNVSPCIVPLYFGPFQRSGFLSAIIDGDTVYSIFTPETEFDRIGLADAAEHSFSDFPCFSAMPLLGPCQTVSGRETACLS